MHKLPYQSKLVWWRITTDASASATAASAILRIGLWA